MHLAFDPTASLHYHVLHFPDAHPEASSLMASYDSTRVPDGVASELVRCASVLVANRAVGAEGLYPRRRCRGCRARPVVVGSIRTVYMARPSVPRCVFTRSVLPPLPWWIHYKVVMARRQVYNDQTPRLNTLLRQPRSRRTDGYDGGNVPCGYLSKSEQGVYYTLVHGYKLWVWVLREASEKRPRPEWELKHQADLELSLRRHYNNSLGGDGIGKSWVLEETLEALSNHRGDHGWDSSDEDSIIDVQGERRINKPEGYIQSYDGMDLLCYHPYKEIVFLCSHYNGFAYYLGSYKLESLGRLRPGGLFQSDHAAPTVDSIVYTPCMDDLLHAHHDL
ncbi:uncharacterized protein LOC112269730 [Brachypodium distachyon]|uniref:uncharacterized protein LOC112269730 n=1 Tax=Brachypodium distachyon TaxID=15368 RepID=UPI000D0E0E08|nr:uncharacterized protein LOC112269730 [Brachypodium distachyon]|eukprot:XP_024312463.1 uncharacterized protein LOC112269730 [Brachypodium distachyon]